MNESTSDTVENENTNAVDSTSDRTIVMRQDALDAIIKKRVAKKNARIRELETQVASFDAKLIAHERAVIERLLTRMGGK